MKKWLIISAASLFALTACGGQGNDVESSTDDQNENEETENTEETAEDENSEEDNTDMNEEETAEDSAEIVYEINSDLWTVQPIEGTDADPEVVLLTIDDAPHDHGVEMAKTLKELDAPAIFFVNGHFIDTEEKAEELREIHEMGFEIGNHTKTHQNLREATEEKQREEIIELNDMIEEIIGERPRFFRAPHGINTDYSRSIVEDEGMTNMNWTYGYDWETDYMEKDAIADIMVNTELLGDGGNLLMHDREWSADALEDIVNGLRDKGYDLVDPDQLK
ncbi:polysaccharide deacetylase family protein [Shouchella patagoniensis]|uniref:polysaccharide deacetylase family protein n=1 Tax=Shouchella patagoniensis TaxID=228576 RepID=UPI0009955FE2|nr:polysaccharide deacetylase family protein [Shouchella patagoniensis]